MFKTVIIPSDDQPENITKNSHRIFVIDCSGSMSGTINEIANNLKNKIPSITLEGDFVSIIWFQHESTFGCLLEHVPVGTLVDIQNINTAIDRWLRADGGTYFADGIKLANSLAAKYTERSQIFFMTDGCENNYNETTLEEFKNATSSVILVEYGYYTDTPYLEKLTETCEGQLIKQSGFTKLNSTFDNYLKNTVVDRKNIFELKTDNNVVDFCDDNLQIYYSKNGLVRLSKDIKNAFEIDTTKIEKSIDPRIYLAILYAFKIKDEDLVWKFLQASGDVYFMKDFANCFSKQDRLNFINNLIVAYNVTGFRGMEGINHDYIPKEDSFTVIDLIALLESDPKALFFPYHKDFEYERISRKVESKDPFYFTANKDLGSKVAIVYNNTRANISFNCKVYGHKVYYDEEKIEPMETYRNFAIIKDGIKNVECLPFRVGRETFDILKAEGMIEQEVEYCPKTIYTLVIKNHPVINKAMTKGVNVTARSFFELYAKRHILQSERKYLKSRLKMLTTDPQEEENEGSFERQTREKSQDFYMSRELIVGLKGCSSIPTVNEKLFSKLDSGKATISESLMQMIHEEFASIPEEGRVAFCQEKIKELDSLIKGGVTTQLVKMNFTVLVANKWFTDLGEESADKEEGSMNFDVEYKSTNFNFTATVKIQEKKIEL